MIKTISNKSPAKKTLNKTVAQKATTPVVVPAIPVSRKTIKKSPAPKKEPQKKSFSKYTSISNTKATPKEGVKMLGILHLAGNLLSGGTLGLVLVLVYLLVRKNVLSQLEKETCYEIINFNISFIIYLFIASMLIFVIIGFLIFPVVLIAWFVLMILGFIRHLIGENYRYPFIIRFVS